VWVARASPCRNAEFHACFDKLLNTVIDGIDQRRLLLVYERDDLRRRPPFSIPTRQPWAGVNFVAPMMPVMVIVPPA
jgi:hypothetical protein